MDKLDGRPEGQNLSYGLNERQIICDILDGEAILVNLKQGTYYSIAGCGAVIWQMLIQGMSPDRIFLAVSQRYGLEFEGCVSSITTFIDQLLSERLLAVRTTSLQSAGEADNLPDWPDSFTPPELEIYTDMEDMIKIDPIHDVDMEGWPSRSEGDG